jgi:hypothetical protein
MPSMMRRYFTTFAGKFDYLLAGLLLLATALPLVVILQLHAGVLPNYWANDVGMDLLGWTELGIWLALVLQLAIPQHAKPALAVMVIIAMVLVTGMLPALSVVLFMLASTLVGTACLQLFFPTRSPPGLLLPALFTGLALYLGLFSVMTHYYVNYRSVIVVLWLLPVATAVLLGKFNTFTRIAGSLARSCNHGLQKIPYLLLVLLATVLGHVASHAFFPTMSHDDQSLHLRLWTELTYQHHAAFDFHTNVSVMLPMLVDLQHALVSLVAGSDARASLNLFWTALLLIQLASMLQRHLRHAGSTVLLVVLFASTPMLGNLLFTLQTELFMALLVTSGVALIFSPGLRWYSAEMLALLAIAALCCATKVTGAVLGLLLLMTAGVQLIAGKTTSDPPQKLQWLWLSGYLAMLALLAFSAYFTAWRMTGNPLFPLYNAVFHSPWFASDSNFIDSRWATGFSLNSYWEVFFATSRHFESENFVAGFQYLLLLPLALIKAATGANRRQWLLILIPLGGFGLVMFASLQYWRYLFPVLPLASLVLAALLEPARTKAGQFSRCASYFALGAMLILNLYFYPGINWLFQQSPFAAITDAQRNEMLVQYATPAAINERLNASTPGLRVLYPQETGFGATLNGQPLYPTWYSPATLARALRVKTDADVADFLQEEKVDVVVWSLGEAMPASSIKWLLGKHLSRFGFPEFQLASHIVYRLSGQELAYRPAFSLAQWNTAQSSPAIAFTATATPVQLTQFGLQHARAARYTVSYRCGSSQGYFIAQLNWDNGGAYYRLLPCAESELTYSEAMPVPAGANSATIFLTARDRPLLEVTALTVETL